MHRFAKWRDSIQTSPDARSVAALMREYVACIPREETVALPLACRRLLEDPDLDLQSTAVALLQADLSYQGHAEGASLLHEISQTFAAASIRLSQLHGRAEPTPHTPR
jgi:hypothetical protein